MYEYTCKHCDESFEVLVRSSDTPAPICSSCGGEVVRRISTFAMVGSGKSMDLPMAGGGGCCGGGCACGH
ncbi:MAG: FmdB family zinc ribbon protein [Chloroflexota bacterium]